MLLITNNVLQLNKSNRYDKTDTYNVGPSCVRTLTQDGQSEGTYLRIDGVDWTLISIELKSSPLHQFLSGFLRFVRHHVTTRLSDRK